MLIADIVAKQFGVPRGQLLGKRRWPRIVLARHVAMTLALEMVPYASLSAVGSWFGGRHHTTVLHSKNTIMRKIARDKGFAKQVEELRQLISKAG
jgi:chromosomal replication initiator protein